MRNCVKWIHARFVEHNCTSFLVCVLMLMLVWARRATNTDFTLCALLAQKQIIHSGGTHRIPFYQRPQLMHAARYAFKMFHFAFELHQVCCSPLLASWINETTLSFDNGVMYGSITEWILPWHVVQFIATIKLYRELLIFMSRKKTWAASVYTGLA